MKYDRNMGVAEFVKITCEMGFRFPWRLCATPSFRKRILNFLENGATPKEVLDDCSNFNIECYFFGKKNK